LAKKYFSNLFTLLTVTFNGGCEGAGGFVTGTAAAGFGAAGAAGATLGTVPVVLEECEACDAWEAWDACELCEVWLTRSCSVSWENLWNISLAGPFRRSRFTIIGSLKGAGLAGVKRIAIPAGARLRVAIAVCTPTRRKLFKSVSRLNKFVSLLRKGSIGLRKFYQDRYC
jgi:hypothetical protein